jgi:hypothetical protein
MVEHSDDYEQGKGKDQANYVRQGPELNLPGDQPGTADATSTIVNDEGHWLGGRLCVEKALPCLRRLLNQLQSTSIAPWNDAACQPLSSRRVVTQGVLA